MLLVLLYGLMCSGWVLVVVIIHAISTILDLNARLKQRKQHRSNDLEPQPIPPMKGVIT